MKKKLYNAMNNTFSLFCLVAGTILGILNGYPSWQTMSVFAVVEGMVFFVLGTFISYLMLDDKKESERE